MPISHNFGNEDTLVHTFLHHGSRGVEFLDGVPVFQMKTITSEVALEKAFCKRTRQVYSRVFTGFSPLLTILFGKTGDRNS